MNTLNEINERCESEGKVWRFKRYPNETIVGEMI
jgi:hypothetical protein